jgi:acetyl/propionyl-CoA carboxylase alpha subunit
MNTRLQVEHPVTELVYSVDLVREQLRIAAGKPMLVSEWPLAPRGHALECRITSEDPANGFLPSVGRISYLRVPAGPGVRWDSGVEAGDEVGLYYDSMLAKLIVHGADRASAIRRMERALRELLVVGVATNQAFLLRLLADPEFRQGKIDIQFLERRGDLLIAGHDEERDLRISVAAALAEDELRQNRKPAVGNGAHGPSAWTGAGRQEGLR